jgi:hypothetical protein
MLVGDFDSANSVVNTQLEALKSEREIAYRHELWLEFKKIGETALGEAQLLTGQITGLASAMTEHVATLRLLTSLANESGRGQHRVSAEALPEIFGKRASQSVAVRVQRRARRVPRGLLCHISRSTNSFNW